MAETKTAARRGRPPRGTGPRQGIHPQSLRLRRSAAGLTAAELAEAVEESTGIPVPDYTVRAWERGRSRPPNLLVPAIARALGCTVSDLRREARVA